MSAFVLKLIACLTMFIDHIGYVIFDGPSFFNYIGRIAFPIFAFQIYQGYMHTKNVKKYICRLFLLAIISQLPFMLFYSTVITDQFAINVIFTLLFGLIGILIYDKTNAFFGIIATIALGIIAETCSFDYGFYGVAVILLFYIFRYHKSLSIISFYIATLLKYALTVSNFSYDYGILLSAIDYFAPLCLCTMLSSAFIILYTGKKGRDSRYLLYLFYPLHLLLIYALALLGL